MSCFCTFLQKVRSKKTNKKQFQILEKDKYVTPDQMFEAFVGTADDLGPPTYWTFKDVDIQMLHHICYHLYPDICYNFVKPFSPVLLWCRNQYIDLDSKLLYLFLHNSPTGLKIMKFNLAKNTMTHMLFVCYEPCWVCQNVN